MEREPILQMKNIHKSFSGNKVLDAVDFNVYRGRVMALVGENGAGKSTLMKILTHVYTRDAGEVIWKGEPVEFSTIREVQDAGITIIHQELNLVYDLTVAENIFLGRERTNKAGFILSDDMQKEATRLLGLLGLNIHPNVSVKNLSVGEQQLVEIAKALSVNAELIVMDEPTGALSGQEIERLMGVIRRLRDEGKSFVYISHRLDEIFEICDDVTILRDGKKVAESPVAEQTTDSIIAHMVGRELTERFPYENHTVDEEVLVVERLTTDLVEDCSFTLKKGEILGLAGLMGSGRTELARAIYGIYPIRGGRVHLNGREVHLRSPHMVQASGIAYVSEDRKRNGVILGMTVTENTTLNSLRRFVNAMGMIRHTEERQAVGAYIDRMSIKTSGLAQKVRFLSGGNQQKVALAKSLMVEPQVIILDEPTRGVDVGAKQEIFQLINKLTERGVAVLMISSEIEEILGMSDRVMVMHEGRITGCLDREDASQEKIMALAVGKEVTDEAS
jgi:ribose transport system ATP-binding protein